MPGMPSTPSGDVTPRAAAGVSSCASRRQLEERVGLQAAIAHHDVAEVNFGFLRHHDSLTVPPTWLADPTGLA